MLQVTDLIHEYKGVARKVLTERIEALIDNALIEAIENQEDIATAYIFANYDGYNYMLKRKHNLDTDRERKIKEETITFEMYQHVLKQIVERYIQEGYPLRYEIDSTSNNYIKFVGLKELVFNN